MIYNIHNTIAEMRFKCYYTELVTFFVIQIMSKSIIILFLFCIHLNIGNNELIIDFIIKEQ